jgi:hypothetical protein
MDSQKIYLLAELTVLPEFLDDLKGALKRALIPHKFHLEQDYMKRLFTALEGKLAGAAIMTKLNAL